MILSRIANICHVLYRLTVLLLVSAIVLAETDVAYFGGF